MIRRFFSSIKTFPITITNNAWTKMEQVIKSKRGGAFVFSATSGGCNGFNYDLRLFNKDQYEKTHDAYTNRGKITPTVIKQNDAKILIDPISEMTLMGTTIDYVSEDYDKDIFESKFVFTPNKDLASSCGCGISFMPKPN